MSKLLQNPHVMLLFSALALAGAIALLLTNHPVPDWLVGFIGAGVLGGAAVMTPGLSTVERVLGALPASVPVVNVTTPTSGPVSPVAAPTPAPVPATFAADDSDVVGDPVTSVPTTITANGS